MNISDDSESDVLPTPDAILDYVSKVRPNGMPDHTLLIKLGGVYRLLRNFSVDRGLVKNICVVVTGIGRKLITVHVLKSVGGMCQGLSRPKLLVLRLLLGRSPSGDPTRAWDRPVGIL